MAKIGWAILCSLSIFGCAPSISEPASQGGVTVSQPDVGNKLALPMSEKKQSLLTGELILPPHIGKNTALTVVLTVSNPQSYGVPLLFSSGKSGDLLIYNDKGQKIWTWSEQMMFTQALREKVLGAGESIKVRFAVPAKLISELWGSDYTLQATFAGKATESKGQVMNKVTQRLSLKD
ncbi:BsuPI-related putative proteinase inhibitor [Shewanella surugensis]|uniref:Intracellular proteinase inhibitor BsuPI domain-containing protein n=1 Tax=Shewanella surugensis TaxID=212020 RepID=A0ABT0LBP5_9GAMM|nr:BsuPI-related putative proteinase inhibitor [Shewanella surugensis]MCL1125134.1 BsuPI-related putative proteinase inhibitor [Shewanella surugensis]